MSKTDTRAFYFGYYGKLAELEIHEQEKALFLQKTEQYRAELGNDAFEDGILKPEHKKDYELGIYTAKDDFEQGDYEGNEEDEDEEESEY